MNTRIIKIYEDEKKADEFNRLLDIKLCKYQRVEKKNFPFSEKDTVLITYGDSISGLKTGNIKNLHRFMKEKIEDIISAIHILPMFPYTSDDGFSVTDYKAIDSSIGSWQDIENLGKDYDLMFDGVVNHISSESDWFKKCLAGDEKYKDYFIEYADSMNYEHVVRPRTTPLFTEFETGCGVKKYWTTFSADQLDLNYDNPDTATDIIELLVYYASKGAKYIRLDAIGFLWKEDGTTCLHHEKTHEMIKLMREVLDQYFPECKLITETNVPHKENISYFGNGYDEAQMVYQFPLPPLTLFSFLKQDASKLSRWADSLEPLTEKTTYFNFLASHDGIGLRPTEGILSQEERDYIATCVLKHGGRINYKTDSNGGQSPYELNINYQDALSSPYDQDETRIQRFIASQILLMSVIGVPAIYIHSLIGSRNDYYGVETSGINRRINREKLDFDELMVNIDSNNSRGIILDKILNGLSIRREESAFSPLASQQVIFDDARLFMIRRYNKITKESIVAIINTSIDEVHVSLPLKGKDLLSDLDINGSVIVSPLQCIWLKEA